MEKCKRLLLISLDAVTCGDLAVLGGLPFFSRLQSCGTLVTGVESVFVSNTYPAHASVITGLHPANHGLTENTVFAPGCGNEGSNKPVPWRYKRKHIHAETLYDKAAKAGLSSCSILYPSTGGARHIRYNIPEIPGKMSKSARAARMLLYGSAAFVISSFSHFGSMLNGINEPELDDFSVAIAADAIIRYKPELLMLHLIDTDSHKHDFGPGSPEAIQSLRRHDARLGILNDALNKAGISDETGIIVFSDHGCLPVHTAANPDKVLTQLGLIRGQGLKASDYDAYFHCAGGTAFLKILKGRNQTSAMAGRIAEAVLETPYTARLLTEDEMRISGMDKSFDLGIEAAEGYCYGSAHAGQHGYGLSHEDYKVFYLAAGNGIPRGKTISGGCITDICPLASNMLGLEPFTAADGINRIVSVFSNKH